MCHYDYAGNGGENAAQYYQGQPGQARTMSQDAPGEPGGEQTRRFDGPPAGAPGANPPAAEQPGGAPAQQGWQGHPGWHRHGHGGGFPKPMALVVVLFLVLALQGVTVGSVFAAIGSLPIIWLVLIGGAFAMMSRRRRGVQRW